MGGLKDCCREMFLREDEKPRAFRPGSWIFGQEYRYQTDLLSVTPCLVEVIPIIAGTPKRADVPDGLPAPTKANVERDGHKGGGMSGQIRHEAEMMWLFVGTDPEHPRDLGARAEFRIGEGERTHTFAFDEPSCVLVPRGVANTGLHFTDLRRPLLNINLFNVPTKEAAYIEHLYHSTAPMREGRTGVMPDNPERYCAGTGEGPGALTIPPAFVVGSETIGEAPFHAEVSFLTSDGSWMAGTDRGEDKIVTGFHDGYHDGPYPRYAMGAERVVLFVGTDPGAMRDLGATVSCTVGDGIREEMETFTFSRPRALVIPKAVRFGPITVTGLHHNVCVIDILTVPTLEGAGLRPDFTWYSEWHDQQRLGKNG